MAVKTKRQISRLSYKFDMSIKRCIIDVRLNSLPLSIFVEELLVIEVRQILNLF